MSAESEIYEEKRCFVEGELAAMMRIATRGVVQRLEYERMGDEEFVVVDMCTSIFDVNVTADSLWAIAKDVMKAVGEKFE